MEPAHAELLLDGWGSEHQFALTGSRFKIGCRREDLSRLTPAAT